MLTRAMLMSERSGLPTPPRQMVVERGGGARLRWAVAAAGYALLLLGWVFASPFGAAPDEAAHAVRAAAAGAGHWQGEPAAPYGGGAGLTPAQADLLNAQAQDFTIPARLVPPQPCFAGRVDQPAACVNAQPPAPGSGTVHAVTYETTAPPLLYTVAGVAMRLPQPLLAPGYLGRLALALLCALLLAGAVWAASGRGSQWPLAGVGLAATPMVLFLGAAVGTAGVAAAAAICFTTGVLAFWKGPPRRGLSLVIGTSGAVLGLASAGGALALAALVAAALPLMRSQRLAQPGALLASAVVTAALVAGLALGFQHRPLPPGRAGLLDSMGTVVQMAPALLRQAVGAFGWSDVPLPQAAYRVWAGLVVVGVSAALVVSRGRDRLSLALAAGMALAVGTIAEAFVLAPVGWDLRGSFLLPVLSALPVVAGYVLRGARLHGRGDAFLIGAAVAGVQLAGLWESARRYAVGENGPLDFRATAQWAPPGGWVPWLALAAAGGLLVVLALVPLARRELGEEAEGPLVVIDPISISR